MTKTRIANTLISGALILTLAACAGARNTGGAGGDAPQNQGVSPRDAGNEAEPTTIWDLFRGNQADVTVKVNKYIWNAALEVLDFLPVQSVDPFSGVIVTGYGTPPGGGRAYRATIYVKDPALDARSLNLAMQTRGGTPVSASTVRAVEDAILTRARQLRIADGNL
ncbi:protein of unknown function [Salinihabitans flavidus]|uniref:DUF3576 domain-containing protein n=1 Tax=Salinihabitans flavidus TaxID=569882 RepID=A0A1H8T6Z2_9RHOB|nr:DUF3576 domain-containing protein [Salinihabitans flavidus]SEO86268.1 protein of unknown function [Salinihabitans flavidus]